MWTIWKILDPPLLYNLQIVWFNDILYYRLQFTLTENDIRGAVEPRRTERFSIDHLFLSAVDSSSDLSDLSVLDILWSFWNWSIPDMLFGLLFLQLILRRKYDFIATVRHCVSTGEFMTLYTTERLVAMETSRKSDVILSDVFMWTKFCRMLCVHSRDKRHINTHPQWKISLVYNKSISLQFDMI